MDLHPIVAQMAPSPAQKPVIVARGRDVVVTAGAGTGKTRTLVARYLSLLAEGLPLRSVLAITFTRKAAREMRNRVRGEMRAYLARAGLADEERRRWQELYSGLDAARISTIHGFCTEILRAHPAEAGIDPRFEVLQEGHARILLGQAIDEALAWAADEECVVDLFACLGERDLRRTLESLMDRRLEAEAAFDAMPADLFAHWQDAVRRRQAQVVETLLGSQAWQDAAATLRVRAASQPDDLAELQRRAVLAALGRPAETLAEQLDALARVGDIDLRGGRKAAWPGGAEELAEVKDALRALREQWRDRAAILQSSPGLWDRTLAGATLRLKACFVRAAGGYRRLKEARQALDFDDLEQRALALLRDEEAVRARWRSEIRAILVDEFQDTNARQRELVRYLNRGGELFIVGDAKQSIYGFRGADVAVFRLERARIEAGSGRHVPLNLSYRAHRPLIAALNDLLRPVLGDVSDPDRPWVEPFVPLAPVREEPAPGLVAPHVELHLALGTKGAGALDRAADAVAARILALVAGGARIDGDAGRRPLRYGDFAILCRATASFEAYEDALERAGVPFLTVAGRGFYGRPEIRDLLNALRALADPTDDLALAGLLRSPAFGWTDRALYRLAGGRGGDGPLWNRLGALRDELAETDPVGRSADLVAALHDEVGRTPVADVLKAYLDASDYRAALLEAGQARSARNVAKLLADAHGSGIVGVGEFLEYVRYLRDSGAREGEARATVEDAVQIMTVHAAKGLEFPVVIVGDASGGGSGGRRGVLVDAELGVLLPTRDEEDEPSAVYGLGKARADDREDAEAARLLYVAATRARERLILSGTITARQNGRPGKPGGFLGRLAGPDGLDLLDVVLPGDPDGVDARRLPLLAGDTPVSCTIYGANYSGPVPVPRSPGSVAAEAPVPPPLLAPVSAPRRVVDGDVAGQERIPPQRVWRVVPAVRRPRAPAWVVGSLVHEALAAWRFPQDAGPAYRRWGEARARGYGLTDPAQLADAVRRSRALLLRFRAHPLYVQMDGAAQRWHEVPYSVLADGGVESGIIDALYRRDGGWTLVEFKTDDVRSEAELERVLATGDYRTQMARYVAAAEALLGARPQAILCMLNYRGGVRLVEL